MALTIPIESTKVVSLQEYIEYIRDHVDPKDEASLLASAPMLKALGNNRTFMCEYLNTQLREWRSFQRGNAWTSQTFVFGRVGPLVVRANIWQPRPTGSRKAESELFFYELGHDHNFGFLTVGYLGSGYWTTVFECDVDRFLGVPGEPAPITFVERTTLPEGKVMYWRPYKDIHSQEEPEEFSISLNLLWNPPGSQLRDQYYFDLNERRVSGVTPGSKNAGRVLMCSLARYLGDDNTASALEDIVAHHPAERVRLTAYQSLAHLAKTDQSLIWSRAVEDKHPVVQRAARAALDGAPKA
jgi:hypothetical protein